MRHWLGKFEIDLLRAAAVNGQAYAFSNIADRAMFEGVSTGRTIVRSSAR